jgi:hypothetical protein
MGARVTSPFNTRVTAALLYMGLFVLGCLGGMALDAWQPHWHSRVQALSRYCDAVVGSLDPEAVSLAPITRFAACVNMTDVPWTVNQLTCTLDTGQGTMLVIVEGRGLWEAACLAAPGSTTVLPRPFQIAPGQWVTMELHAGPDTHYARLGLKHAKE